MELVFDDGDDDGDDDLVEVVGRDEACVPVALEDTLPCRGDGL